MRSKLEIAFELDRRWRLLRGEMDGSKRLQDLADAHSLVEGDATLLDRLTDAERKILDAAP
jgi:hypothetical protein